MAAPFKEPPHDFAAGKPAGDSYAKQLTAFEQRSLNAGRDLQSWRLMTFATMALAMVATGTSLYLGGVQPKPSVHIVEIDGRTGEPLRHNLIGEPIEINEAMISHMLGRWIQWTRGKSIDPVVLRVHWDDAYHFVPVAAKPAIDAYAREIDAFNPTKLGKEAVTVEVQSVIRQSSKSFQVRWQETVFHAGNRQRQQRFTANIAIDFLEPTTPRQIKVNPLGLMITSIYVQADYTSVESAS